MPNNKSIQLALDIIHDAEKDEILANILIATLTSLKEKDLKKVVRRLETTYQNWSI